MVPRIESELDLVAHIGGGAVWVEDETSVPNVDTDDIGSRGGSCGS